jgi:hypothetical protein
MKQMTIELRMVCSNLTPAAAAAAAAAVIIVG